MSASDPNIVEPVAERALNWTWWQVRLKDGRLVYLRADMVGEENGEIVFEVALKSASGEWAVVPVAIFPAESVDEWWGGWSERLLSPKLLDFE